MLDPINRKEIERLVYDYTVGIMKDVDMCMAFSNIKKSELTVDKCIEEFTKSDKKLSYSEVCKTLITYINSGVCDEDTLVLCQYLLQHKNISNKLVAIYDGSYRNNRIFFKFDKHGVLHSMILINNSDFLYDDHQIDYILEYLYINYDTVYFHGYIPTNMNDFNEWRHNEIIKNKFLEYYS